MAKARRHLSVFTAAICAAYLTLLFPLDVDAFGLTSKGLQTRYEARVLHSTVANIIPFNNVSEESKLRIAVNFDGPPKACQIQVQKKTLNVNALVRSIFFFVAIIGTVTTIAPPTAYAAVKKIADAQEAAEHLHVGQKIANYFRSFGLPDLAVIAAISALPVVELRGAVPVGLWMGLPIAKVLPVCVLGNMVPIVPLLFLLRNDKLKNLMSPILSRAEKKSASLGVGSTEKQWASLAAFVGIPLPGTGAWTGAMGAFLLGMPTAVALSSIFTGVVSAGVIMTAITLAGKKGGIAALAVLALITGREFVSNKDEGTTDS